MHLNVHNARIAGFTLIELLVTVSIIALLMSLLLPAVGLVRKAAQSISCASHQRQIALAVFAYANDHEGYLVSYRVMDGSPTGREWHDSLAPYANAEKSTGALDMNGYNVFMKCPAWNGPGMLHWTKLGYGMPLRNNMGSTNPFKSDWYWAASEPIRDGHLGELTFPSQRILVGESAVKYLEATSGPPALWRFWNTYLYDQTKWSIPANTPPANPVRHSGRANYSFVDGRVQSMGPLTSPWGYTNPSKLTE